MSSKYFTLGWDPGLIVMTLWLFGHLFIAMMCIWIVKVTIADYNNWKMDDDSIMPGVITSCLITCLLNVVIICVSMAATIRKIRVKIAQQGDAPECRT